MDTTQMRMMLVIADCKSMTKAAHKLDVTQPALTYQLNVIEEELGFRVFDRTRTGTSLTSEGEFLMSAVGSFIADYEEALRLARTMARGDGAAIGGRATAVIGTVLGDAHDMGKNLVRTMLERRDIEVADLGSQVPPAAFVEHVREHAACKLVLVSVSRTELLGNARAILDALEDAGLRDRVKVMVGGAAASQEFADEAGADAFTESADAAADAACELMRAH